MEGITIPDKVAMKGRIWHKARHWRAPLTSLSGVMTGLIVCVRASASDMRERYGGDMDESA